MNMLLVLVGLQLLNVLPASSSWVSLTDSYSAKNEASGRAGGASSVVHSRQALLWGGYQVSTSSSSFFSSTSENDASLANLNLAGVIFEQGAKPSDAILRLAVPIFMDLELDGSLSFRFGEMDPSSNYWPSGRKFHCLQGPLNLNSSNSLVSFVAIGGTHLQSGLMASDSTYLNVVTILENGKFRWSQVPVKSDADYGTPTPRQGQSCTSSSNDVFVFGGFSYNGDAAQDGNAYQDDLWVLRWVEDVSSFQWEKPRTVLTQAQDQKPSHRQGHTLISFDDQLVLFGGMRYTFSQVSSFQGDVEFLDDLWVLNLQDPSALQWEKRDLGTRPPRRSGHVAVRVGNKMLVHGGQYISRSDERHIQLYSDLWELDTTTWTWTELHPAGTSPTGCSSHVGLLLSSSYFVTLGGVRLMDIGQNPLRMSVIEPVAHMLSLL